MCMQPITGADISHMKEEDCGACLDSGMSLGSFRLGPDGM